MKVLVVVDGHLYRTPDGKIWASRIYNYDFFARYLSAFEEVRVAIRITDVPDNHECPIICSGLNIEYCAIEEFKGPKEYMKKYFKIKKSLSGFFDGCDCGIFRIPSTVGYQFLNAFQKTGKPYSVEVVVDPWDFAAPGMLKTPLRPLIRRIWTKNLKRACLKANGVSYVTQFALQERYPSYARLYGESETKFESYYSSVNINKDYYGFPKNYSNLKSPAKIIHVTNVIGNHVKGHEELIKAVSLLKKRHIEVKVTFVGEGPLIPQFVDLANSLNIESNIEFIGKISDAKKLRAILSDGDLFVFPSHAEGLPRVVIEAMAVGLPVIATKINGIPELLDDDYLVQVGDVEQLANKIEWILSMKEIYNQASINNIEKSKLYCEDELQKRRTQFYNKLRSCCM